MIAIIGRDGVLKISPETELEAYALSKYELNDGGNLLISSGWPPAPQEMLDPPEGYRWDHLACRFTKINQGRGPAISHV